MNLWKQEQKARIAAIAADARLARLKREKKEKEELMADVAEVPVENVTLENDGIKEAETRKRNADLRAFMLNPNSGKGPEHFCT